MCLFGEDSKVGRKFILFYDEKKLLGETFEVMWNFYRRVAYFLGDAFYISQTFSMKSNGKIYDY